MQCVVSCRERGNSAIGSRTSTRMKSQLQLPERLWVCRGGPANAFADAFYGLGIVGLTIPFIDDATHASRHEIAVALSGSHRAQAPNMAAMLSHFVRDVEAGDLVITPAGRDKPLLVGRVAGRYRYEPSPGVPGLRHQRLVAWRYGPQWQRLSVAVRQAVSAPVALYRPAAVSVIVAELGSVHR